MAVGRSINKVYQWYEMTFKLRRRNLFRYNPSNEKHTFVHQR